MTILRGKVSWFGGPADTGVSPDEGLAFIYDVDMQPELFLLDQPPGTTGLARRLDPEQFYIALRWDYDATSKADLLDMVVTVHAPRTGIVIEGVYPADWGPHIDTGRIADISPGLMSALGIETDDEVIVAFNEQERTMPYQSVVISSGHGKYVRGAHGILDEVDEARKVVDALAEALHARGLDVVTFHDDTSKDQSTNLATITDAHNCETRDLDISVHFNAYEQVSKPMGVEVLYITQQALASEVSAAIASVGFINRGAKKRSDLYFLNNTEMPAILLEVCFVDSEADADIYGDQFTGIIEAIADVLGGEMDGAVIDPPTEELPPPILTPVPTINIEVAGEVIIYVNGDLIHQSKG
jgi:N-acetylmuramoyl-L-alanine amidase